MSDRRITFRLRAELGHGFHQPRRATPPARRVSLPAKLAAVILAFIVFVWLAPYQIVAAIAPVLMSLGIIFCAVAVVVLIFAVNLRGIRWHDVDEVHDLANPRRRHGDHL
jgi:uncharacterized membrane protein